MKWFSYLLCSLVMLVSVARGEVFPEVGLALPIPDAALRIPPAMPEVPYGTMSLWLERQFLAEWMDSDGTGYCLRHMLFVPPQLNQVESRDLYDEHFAIPDFNNTVEGAAEWLAVDELVVVAKQFYGLAALYRAPGDRGRQFFYVLRVPDNYEVDFPWCVLQVTLPQDRLEQEVREQLQKELFSKLVVLSPRECAAAKKTTAKQLLDATALERTVSRLVRHAGWWVTRAGSYLLTGDIGEEATKSLTSIFEEKQLPLNKAFRKLLPPVSEIEGQAFVRVIRENALYAYYTGDRSGKTAGIYSPMRKELILRMQGNVFDTEQTLRHESFHQYLDTAWAGHMPVAWLNEGHAVYFEYTECSKKEIEFVDSPIYVEIVDNNLDKVIENIPTLLTCSYEDFYAGGTFNYACAWAWVTFLHQGAPLDHKKTFANILPRYREAVLDGKDTREATAYALEGITIKQIQNRFRIYWTRERTRASANATLKLN